MPTAFAPGRVTLIGDHTDYTGGLALPMAIQLGTTVTAEAGGTRVVFGSDQFDGVADLSLVVDDPAAVEPAWARYVAGVVAQLQLQRGCTGRIGTTLPIGTGLSSSASLEVAVALALGFSGSALDLALLCQRAEQQASGVPCGVMDQLTATSGVEGYALLMDCETNTVTPVAVPEGCEIVAVQCGESRSLAGSAYADRRAACEAAAALIGPLRRATLDEVATVPDPTLRRRARHVVTENGRVSAFAGALADGDLALAGDLMVESHVSLRDDFEVSSPVLDALVGELIGTPGVHGARLTGAGFGGCAVALAEPGALSRGWVLHPTGGAAVWPEQ